MGTFSVACTIPIALLMGVYLRWFRPGRILEVSVIGLVLLLSSIAYGAHVAAMRRLRLSSISMRNRWRGC